MKITMNNGITFEGTQAEYEEFLAYAERKIAEDEAKEAQVEETIEFEGATYRKVEREAREGDVIVLSQAQANETTYVTAGKPYKVLRDESFVVDNGDQYGVYRRSFGRTRETVDVYEPIEQAKYVPQEGDIVVITDDSASNHSLGDIGKITEVKVDTFRVTVPGKKNRGNWLMDFRFRKATPAEVEKYEQAVKDAEIAEKWAKIGRKPNEFKKGDVVRVIDNMGTIAIRVGDVAIVNYQVKESGSLDIFVPSGGTRYVKGELIAPVESLFNA